MNSDDDKENEDRVSEASETRSDSSGKSAGSVLIPQPHGGALRPFPKGQSGNPGGRPANPLKPVLTRKLDEAALESVVQKAIEQAQDGDDKARRWLFEYLIGKPGLAPEDREALEKSGGGIDALAVILGKK